MVILYKNKKYVQLKRGKIMTLRHYSKFKFDAAHALQILLNNPELNELKERTFKINLKVPNPDIPNDEKFDVYKFIYSEQNHTELYVTGNKILNHYIAIYHQLAGLYVRDPYSVGDEFKQATYFIQTLPSLLKSLKEDGYVFEIESLTKRSKPSQP